MTLSKGVYRPKNPRSIEILSICSVPMWFFWLIHQLWSCTVPIRVSPRVPVAFIVGRLVLHWGNTRAIMCSYGGASWRMYWKSHLQIICIYTRSSYSRPVSNSLGKTLKSCSRSMKSGGFGFWLVKTWFIMKFFITNFF